MARRKPNELPIILPDQELRQINTTATTERDRLILLLLMYLMGLRVSEVCKFKIRHLDFQKKVVFINQDKGGNDAKLPVPDTCSAR